MSRNSSECLVIPSTRYRRNDVANLASTSSSFRNDSEVRYSDKAEALTINSVADPSRNKQFLYSTMRFLLNPGLKPPKVVRQMAHRATFEPSVIVSRASTKNSNSSYTKSWGQQCSPSCGCIVRFEAIVDRASQKIVDATYHAKSIISIQKNGRLEPMRTMRTSKPMMKECKCNTLHTLAKEITSFIPNKNLDSVRNMNEFSQTRSSPAFRHAVLVDNELPRTDTHCFDVLEEAFTAMIKGFLPSQRRNMNTFDKILSNHLKLNVLQENDLDTSSLSHETGLDNSQLSMSPRSISTLSMFDINAEYWENEEYHMLEQQNKEHKMRSLDWLSFVDEQHSNEKWA